MEWGIGRASLSRWSKQLGADCEDGFRGVGGLVPEQADVRRLEDENETLTKERDALESGGTGPLPLAGSLTQSVEDSMAGSFVSNLSIAQRLDAPTRKS